MIARGSKARLTRTARSVRVGLVDAERLVGAAACCEGELLGVPRNCGAAYVGSGLREAATCQQTGAGAERRTAIRADGEWRATQVGTGAIRIEVAQIADLVSLTPPDFSTLAGSASTFYAALCAGVSGGILALSSLAPGACVRLFNLVGQGKHDEARRLQRQLLPLARFISTGYGVPGLKAALKLTGIDVGWPRLPLAPAPDSAVEIVRNALNTFEETFA